MGQAGKGRAVRPGAAGELGARSGRHRGGLSLRCYSKATQRRTTAPSPAAGLPARGDVPREARGASQEAHAAARSAHAGLFGLSPARRQLTGSLGRQTQCSASLGRPQSRGDSETGD
jgi:hypothetical protein